MKGLFADFKEFAVKGNAMDMAVGIIIGGAFGKIISSLVADIITPPLGFLLGNKFSHLSINLREANANLPEITLDYGKFLQSSLDFLIIAFTLFLVVKFLNKLRHKEDKIKKDKPPVPSAEEKLLVEIRDLLKKQ